MEVSNYIFGLHSAHLLLLTSLSSLSHAGNIVCKPFCQKSNATSLLKSFVVLPACSKTMHTTDSKCRVPLNNRPFKTPRKLRVVCIGAGFAGLTLAYKISHELKLEDVLDFQIYERQARVPPSPSLATTLTSTPALRRRYLARQPIPRLDVRRAHPRLHPPLGTET